MILFITLCLLALAVAVISITMLVAGGTTFIVVFGDLIVCVFLIILLIRFAFKKKDK